MLSKKPLGLKKIIFILIVFISLAIMLTGTAIAWDWTGDYIFRASVNSSGSQANGSNYFAQISADGRYVAFISYATNLVSGDTNGDIDIFRKDLETGQVVRVSTSSSGGQADNVSYAPAISSDGRYIAFRSFASNLVSSDTNGKVDIFRKDMQSGTTVRVSVSSSGGQANGGSWLPSISADGRYVAFESHASNLVSGDTNGVSDILRKDLQTGEIVRVNVSSSGRQTEVDSYSPSINADGKYVVFESYDSNLVSNDTNGMSDIFRKNLQTGGIVRVSTNSSAGQTNGDSVDASISSDGRYVVFRSSAPNLVSGDTNGKWDIFRKDLQTGEVTRANLSSSGGQANNWSNDPAISPDGRYVVFESLASNLVSGDTNGKWDIFRKDLQTGEVTRVNLSSSGGQSNGAAFDPSVSSAGRYVVFWSSAPNLVSGDTNVKDDIFFTDISVYPYDTTPPTASMNTPYISTNNSPTNGFSISWSGEDIGSGIASYQVKYRPHTTTSWTALKIDGSYWTKTKWVRSTTFIGTSGYSYYFRVRAKDDAGNIGNFSAATYTVVPYGHKAPTYYGNWSTTSYDKNLYMGYAKYSSAKDDYLTYTAPKGVKEIYIVVTRRSNGGRADISLNGQDQGTIDLYSSLASVSYRKIAWSKEVDPARTNTIKIVVTGTKQIASSGTRIEINGIGLKR